MQLKGGHVKISDGLSDDTPLGARIGRIKVAVRPPDPRLMDKLSSHLKQLSDRGISLPKTSSMAVRSIDGFYYIMDLAGSVSRPEIDVVSVVNYDPVRRTFILSGNGSVDDIGELFWYAFEAFLEDNIVFLDKGEERDFRSPDQLDDRVSFNIGILKEWKERPLMKENGRILWRGLDLDSFFRMVETNYGHEAQSKSQ